jgi:hypothetical protein
MYVSIGTYGELNYSDISLPNASPLGIKPSSVRFRYGSKILQDDGAGNLSGDGVGTINYTTGAYDVTFDTLPPEDGEGRPSVWVDYQYNEPTEVNLGYEYEIDVDVTPFYRANEVKTVLGIPNCVIGMDARWAHKDTKLGFYLDVPGENVRLRWQTRVKDSAVAQPPTSPVADDAKRGLRFNVSDYDGEVNHGTQADPEPGWTIHWWTFEPSGKQIAPADARTPKERYEQGAGLVVDPYLSVDEQSTYVDVWMDGAKARFYFNRTDSSSDAIEFFNSSDTEIAKSRSYLYDLEVYGHHRGNYMSVVENTPTRVKLLLTGEFNQLDGGGAHTNSNGLKIYFTVYPDRIFMDFAFDLSGDIDWDASEYDCLLGLHETSLTNNTGIYESSESELTTSSGDTARTGDYVGLTSDEVNAVIILLNDDTDGPIATETQYSTVNGASINARGEAYTSAHGTQRFQAVMILDFAEREGSAQIYNSTDRLALGDQYKDRQIDLTEGGSRVFNDGSTQYLKYGTAAFTDEPFAMVCWFKTDDDTIDQTLMAMSDEATDNEEYALELEGTGDYLKAISRAGGTNAVATTSTSWSQDQWHHACGIWEADNSRKVRLDDGGNTTETTSSVPTGLDNTAIGARVRSSVGNPVSGKIAHAAIFDLSKLPGATTGDKVDYFDTIMLPRLAAGARPDELNESSFSLAHYWPLIDNDKDIIGGYDMTPVNSPTWSTTDYPNVWKPDKGKWEIQNILPAVIDESGFQSDGAFHIMLKEEIAEGSRVFDDGSSQGLRNETQTPVTGPPFTMGCFVKTDDLTTDQCAMLVHDENSNSERFSLKLDTTSDLVQAISRDGGVSSTAETSSSYSANIWHHICARFTSTTSRDAFLDGGSKGSNTDSSTPSGIDALSIGMRDLSTPDNFLSGKIAHAAIWNVALTDAEVAVLARGADPRSIRRNNLVAYWPLTTDDDDIIGSYDMTAYNSPTWSTTDYPLVKFKETEAKYTLDRTRIRPNTVIPDWPFQYGPVADPTDIVLNKLKMDDNAADNVLKAEVGPDGSWHLAGGETPRNTNLDSVQVNNFRGRALDQQDDTSYGKLAAGAGTVHDNAFLKKGGLLMKVTPNFGYDTATGWGLFEIYYSATQRILGYYDDTNDWFRVEFHWTNEEGLISYAFTENYSFQRQMVFLVSWDSDRDIAILSIDGVIQEVQIHTGAVTSSDPTDVYIGNNWAGSGGDYTIDEITTFSEFVFPGGGYHIGNGSGLLADIDTPHADLCFFWDAQSVNAKGGANLATSKTGTLGSSGGSFGSGAALVGTNGYDNEASSSNYTISFAESSEDIIDYNNGSIGIWVNVQTLSDDKIFYVQGDADNFIDIDINSSNFRFRYRSGGTVESITGSTVTAGIWYWLRFSWDDTNQCQAWVQNISQGVDAIANAWAGGTGNTLYFCAESATGNNLDAFIGRAFISKDPNTPEIWTAFGKPLHQPLIIEG